MSKTNRRKFLGTAAAICAGTAAAAMPGQTAAKKYPMCHHVFFWLKNPGSKEDRDALIAGLKTLAKIPTVRDLRVGIVANTEARGVVDTTWGVSELMFFDNVEGEAAYQVHPIHQEFIKKCSHLWDKVIVYDAMEV
ncbi:MULTISPECIES: Dabb family protein [Chitinophaga]|uniref:Dabb family protein n=1 Tax=Chitinophaga caseinilytica TaxID=2267521 RepID=A0ABZ2YWV4_9BACT|nr:Dabb family protein [Chitinophaga rhizosphaerae]